MVGKKVYWYTSEIGIKKNASNKMRETWTTTVQYIFKYKQNLERAVKNNDERDEMRKSEQ
jgi:hypothetical protein